MHVPFILFSLEQINHFILLDFVLACHHHLVCSTFPSPPHFSPSWRKQALSDACLISADVQACVPGHLEVGQPIDPFSQTRASETPAASELRDSWAWLHVPSNYIPHINSAHILQGREWLYRWFNVRLKKKPNQKSMIPNARANHPRNVTKCFFKKWEKLLREKQVSVLKKRHVADEQMTSALFVFRKKCDFIVNALVTPHAFLGVAREVYSQAWHLVQMCACLKIRAFQHNCRYRFAWRVAVGTSSFYLAYTRVGGVGWERWARFSRLLPPRGWTWSDPWHLPRSNRSCHSTTTADVRLPSGDKCAAVTVTTDCPQLSELQWAGHYISHTTGIIHHCHDPYYLPSNQYAICDPLPHPPPHLIIRHAPLYAVVISYAPPYPHLMQHSNCHAPLMRLSTSLCCILFQCKASSDENTYQASCWCL